MARDLLTEFRWRGLLQDSTPGVEELLAKGPVPGYIGFDPTADSLHVGSLVPVMLLVHFQHCGHAPIALVGGATGMVGDPSGKKAERQLLDEDTLQHNVEALRKQLERFLDFSPGATAARIVNNYDWFKDMGFLRFIRDVGKHVSVNYMMAKDSVKNRLEEGISFTEFSYQLVQGYDFHWLHRNMDCHLQMGGSDQWGNITTGIELIRRLDGGEAYAITAPLLTKADGSKFGKSEGGNVWLDPVRTSPYRFYQFWLNASDADAGRFARIFTTWERAEVESLEMEHAKSPHLRRLQKEVAADITRRVHGEEELRAALQASEILFGSGTTKALASLNEQQLLDVFEGVPQGEVGRDGLAAGLPILDLLTDGSGFLPSKGEARRALKENSIALNRAKVDEERTVGTDDLIAGRYLLLQRGKKNYFLVKVV
ncbi:MAG: tyrosine--tRNA ligase [Flavobacteriales bacterium]|nr:tyrosine--tRNA ligase [Flavobacteriales bacterium]MCB9166704.1 tyrosine--tRNA ligase [Flavobacteriales bacterium]